MQRGDGWWSGPADGDVPREINPSPSAHSEGSCDFNYAPPKSGGTREKVRSAVPLIIYKQRQRIFLFFFKFPVISWGTIISQMPGTARVDWARLWSKKACSVLADGAMGMIIIGEWSCIYIALLKSVDSSWRFYNICHVKTFTHTQTLRLTHTHTRIFFFFLPRRENGCAGGVLGGDFFQVRVSK